jgi:hypothetical protein
MARRPPGINKFSAGLTVRGRRGRLPCPHEDPGAQSPGAPSARLTSRTHGGGVCRCDAVPGRGAVACQWRLPAPPQRAPHRPRLPPPVLDPVASRVWVVGSRPPGRRPGTPSGWQPRPSYTRRVPFRAVHARARPRTAQHTSTTGQFGLLSADVGPGGGAIGRNPCKSLVGARGFEPRTSSLSRCYDCPISVSISANAGLAPSRAKISRACSSGCAASCALPSATRQRPCPSSACPSS